MTRSVSKPLGMVIVLFGQIDRVKSLKWQMQGFGSEVNLNLYWSKLLTLLLRFKNHIARQKFLLLHYRYRCQLGSDNCRISGIHWASQKQGRH